MSLLTPPLLQELVAEARLAPSVHNIQPTRWRLLPDGRLALIDDSVVRASCADPTGHDVRVSHGAALEGMSLPLNRRGLSLSDIAIAEDRLSAQYTSLCMPTVGSTGVSDPLHDSVMRRMSCIRDRAALSEIAQWADQAELSFVRRADFRRELLDWMRLTDRHPCYLRDGLNREALSMSGLEAIGAGWVLGKLFAPLDWSGIAASLLSDQAKTSSADGVVLFCRPRGEDPLLTGRHFYRLWLEIDRAGFAAVQFRRWRITAASMKSSPVWPAWGRTSVSSTYSG
jgi:nitroreductase